MRTFHLVLIALLIGCGCSAQKQQAEPSVMQQLEGGESDWQRAKEPALSADSHFAAGMLAESHPNLPRAIDQYERCLKINPQHEQALFRLGIIRSQLKQYPQAIETWKRYAAATGDSAVAYSNLGLAYELAKRPAEAEAAYKKGIQRDAGNEACRVNYGLMLARSGRVPEAVKQFSEVLTPAQVSYNIASVYEQQGKTEQAREEYRRALELDPAMRDAQTRLAALR